MRLRLALMAPTTDVLAEGATVCSGSRLSFWPGVWGAVFASVDSMSSAGTTLSREASFFVRCSMLFSIDRTVRSIVKLGKGERKVNDRTVRSLKNLSNRPIFPDDRHGPGALPDERPPRPRPSDAD